MRKTFVAIFCALVCAALAPLRAVGQEPVGCSWPTWLNEDTFNFAFPDDSATYWGAHFPFAPGARLVIDGAFPAARYFSIHAYDEAQRPVDSIADHEIDPIEGTNRYRGGDGAGRYRVFVEFSAAPEEPDRNTVYAGAMSNGAPNPGGFILYRVYTPDDPTDLSGGPLPVITLQGPGGSAGIEFGTCDPLPPDAGGQVNDVIRDQNYTYVTPNRSHHPAATNPPTFKRFYGTDQFPRDFTEEGQGSDATARSEGGFLSNQQIAYLYAYTSREYGDVVVMRPKAPTFPDTRRGDAPWLDREVRYWSVCQNNGLSQRMTDCAPDHETPLDPTGYFTVVISDPKDRPRNATAKNGVRWLPWGGLYYDGLVIYRHMLPANGFDAAIQRVPEGKRPAPVMGDYYPEAGYCGKKDFESGGWRACLRVGSGG
ncbi:MAG: hypothetical protein ACRDLB_01665 [Actinomycetota bacterium]